MYLEDCPAHSKSWESIAAIFVSKTPHNQKTVRAEMRNHKKKGLSAHRTGWGGV